MTTPDPWDDDRLAAAFAARAAMATQVPADLPTDTTIALRRRRTRSDAPWWRPLPMAAAAALVVSIVGLSLAMSWRTGAPPATTGPSAPVASGAAPSDVATENVLGLPVIDVPAALAVRDAGEDDRELAVSGWYSPIAVPCPAMYVKRDSPLQPNCDEWVVLAAYPESLSREGLIGGRPPRDVVQMDLDGIDASSLPPMPNAGQAEPVDIVVVGHFDDRRSRLCPPDIEQACRDRFVIDRIETVDGKLEDLSHVVLLDGESPQSTLASVQGALASVAQDAVVLSVVTANNAWVEVIEPTLEVDPADFGDGASWILSVRWVIRTLEAGRPQTYVVTDGTNEVWRMDIDGNLFRVGGPIATPTPTEGPWPPPNTVTRFPLTSGVGTGLPPVEVAILDPSGVTVAAREVQDDDPVVEMPDDGFAGRAWVAGQPGDTSSIRLGWTGGVCDHHVTVTVDSLDSILIDGGLQPGCDAVGIGRELVLTFREPVDASIIDVSYIETRVDAPIPTDDGSASPAFQDGRLAVVGVDGGPGELFCNEVFPVSGLTALTGAEDRVGPEFDVLRATLADPGFADSAADINALSWREAGRTGDTVVFLAEKPGNEDERYWLELSLRLDPAAGWQFIGGGDCQPRALLPAGVGPATWVFDPAYPEPNAQDSTVHLLVTETVCASGQSAIDRLAPAYVVASPYRIDITIGVHERPGAQECPGNPPVAVEINLGTAIGDRPLIDPNAPPPDGSSG